MCRRFGPPEPAGVAGEEAPGSPYPAEWPGGAEGDGGSARPPEGPAEGRDRGQQGDVCNVIQCMYSENVIKQSV